MPILVNGKAGSCHGRRWTSSKLPTVQEPANFPRRWGTGGWAATTAKTVTGGVQDHPLLTRRQKAFLVNIFGGFHGESADVIAKAWTLLCLSSEVRPQRFRTLWFVSKAPMWRSGKKIINEKRPSTLIAADRFFRRRQPRLRSSQCVKGSWRPLSIPYRQVTKVLVQGS